MGRRNRQMGKVTLVVLAAYLLVLQGLFGALASGRHVGVMLVDQAIYLTTCDPESRAAIPTGEDHQAKLPPCCTQGCTLALAHGGVPPAIATLVAYETVSIVVREPAAPTHGLSPADESSGRPRAPPRPLRTS